MSKELSIVIFSKDRPAQVLACLESLYNHLVEANNKELVQVCVLYKSTNSKFDLGYDKAKKSIKKTNLFWIKETVFREQVLENFKNTISKKTMFLVDDIIFINNFSLLDPQIALLDNQNILATSLRLYNGITHCYATGQDTKVPKFVKGCVWNWQNGEGDWGYPMSVDGNVYRTEHIKHLLASVVFTNPNTMEANMDNIKHLPEQPKMLACYVDAPKLINIPVNRVQNVFQNKFNNDLSAEEINEMFLSGYKIDVNVYSNFRANSCHVATELKFVREV
jgi:hypothetical protein